MSVPLTLLIVVCALSLSGGCASFTGYSDLEYVNGCRVKIHSVEQTQGIDETTKLSIGDDCTVTYGDTEKADDVGLKDIEKE
jgi:hypothetical protein